jgi:predicted nucleic acid-binding Zn ribbon protein
MARHNIRFMLGKSGSLPATWESIASWCCKPAANPKRILRSTRARLIKEQRRVRRRRMTMRLKLLLLLSLTRSLLLPRRKPIPRFGFRRQRIRHTAAQTMHHQRPLGSDFEGRLFDTNAKWMRWFVCRVGGPAATWLSNGIRKLSSNTPARKYARAAWR